MCEDALELGHLSLICEPSKRFNQVLGETDAKFVFVALVFKDCEPDISVLLEAFH